ncbi:hypothetical protein [Achromobacter animicus]|uniref:hypothetical protein n=1 Tax=Achromobacter animicus TaxID=1389935 RepID=UPI002448E3BA|nr:hypothetical protein [Achromobacter animicus]MDH0682857.1 hypothetical protein [Achromobacter animicus]
MEVQATGHSTSMREAIPGRLAALISARPDRLLRQVELSYAALRGDTEGLARTDLVRRLLSRTAELDTAHRNLADWLRDRNEEHPEERARQQKLRQNVDEDLSRLRDVLSVVAALPVAHVKAKALQALLDVHVSVKQLRDLSRRQIQGLKNRPAAEQAVAQSEVQLASEQEASRMRQREGEN